MSWQTVDPNAPLCFCDKKATLATVKKNGPNFGQQFYSCSLASRSNQCRFFQPKDPSTWVDTRQSMAAAASSNTGFITAGQLQQQQQQPAQQQLRK